MTFSIKGRSWFSQENYVKRMINGYRFSKIVYAFITYQIILPPLNANHQNSLSFTFWSWMEPIMEGSGCPLLSVISSHSHISCEKIQDRKHKTIFSFSKKVLFLVIFIHLNIRWLWITVMILLALLRNLPSSNQT